ncbi:Mobile element protein [Streptococcus pneumoniae]|nr:Mobile element protein [Streptococcus pneumoniae]
MDIAVNYSHDMKLFKMSRRNIEQAGKILAKTSNITRCSLTRRKNVSMT